MGISTSAGSSNAFNENGELLSNATEFLSNASADYGSAQTNAVLIAGEAGKVIEIHSIFISTAATSGSIEFNEETSDDLIFKFYAKAQSGSGSGLMHTDLIENKDLLITCPLNTFVSVVYHKRSV